MESMARPDSSALIDTLLDGSVSFAPPDPSDLEPFGNAHSSVSIGAGRLVSTPALLGGASRDGVSGYPIQVGKVQRPPLREETLARHRLLDWLDVKIHNRVVFVIADAGYGKTTLLADFSRRTRLRTLWYRMDEEDRNWVTFLSYLVSAGREHDPEFAPRTHAMLQDTGPGGATRDEAVAMFLRELPDIAPTPTVLILDDYHAAEGSGDVSYVAKSLVTKAPERLTLVISSRRTPEIPVGRLRAQGELAELKTRDLQFSEPEIADLFVGDDGKRMDRESVGLLNRRSEGWAASLQLVRTAIRGRSTAEAREFIRTLSGEHTELYDYLAEEVVGELRAEHQDFLMKTSLLQVVTLPAAVAILNDSTDEVSSWIDQSERLGLISKHGSSSGRYRYHPLVREFLTGRLRSAVGEKGIKALHEVAGEWAAGVDWRAACYHFDAARNIRGIHDVLDRAIDSIAGQGGYELAASYLRRFEPETTTASFEIIASRMEFRAGNFDAAVKRAGQAVALQPELDVAISNAITLYGNTGLYRESWELAKRLADSGTSSLYRTIARASCSMYEGSIDGPLGDEIEFLLELAGRSEADELTQFAGVSHLNIALAEQARGNAETALAHADRAISALLQTHQAAELASAYLSHAAASATLGDLDGSRDDISSAAAVAPTAFRGEWLIEAADVEAVFGSADAAESMLADAHLGELPNNLRNLALTVEARLALRRGDAARAARLADSFEVGEPSDQPGFMSRQLAIRAHAAIANRAANGSQLLETGQRHAERQGAERWLTYCQVLNALRDETGATLNTLVSRLPEREMWVCDSFAEDISRSLEAFDAAVRDRIAAHCALRSERWLPALRAVVGDPESPSRWLAAELLDRVGTVDDIPSLRSLARASRAGSGKALGRTLARRLAPRFAIEDLGRVELMADGRAVSSSSIRRKVLAMLCFLMTRPRFAATRDEVIDALWPDLSPDVAANSLNQTVYFLRRVFEPGYVDDLSAGYVNHSSDVLWLDSELVSSRSANCLAILDDIRADPSPDRVQRLSQEYTDRFALDFAYEEWAVPFRSALHVAYLEVVESAVTRDMATGHHDRAIQLARNALDLDPTVESLEVALLRLYRATGAHAAAAEQYGHYATALKDDLGIEPPPLASL
jgi:LuxR family maltose regulon positive regulatory protein